MQFTQHNFATQGRKAPLHTPAPQQPPLRKRNTRRVHWIRVILWFQSGGGTFEHALACVGVEEVVLGAGAQNCCPVGAVPVLAAVVGVDVLEVVFGADEGCLACYAAPLRSGAKLYIQLLGTHLQVRIVYQAFWAGIQLR